MSSSPNPPGSSSLASLEAAFRDYARRWPEEQASTSVFLELLADAADPFVRERLAGHFTASSWLVDASGTRALLTHHRKLDRWLQLGGHADGDRDLANVALREAEEESGLSSLVVEAELFDLDRHWIPERGDVPVSSEGGHACFAPGDPVEDEILRILRRRYDRVSIERLICGPGLLNMHRALAEIAGRETHIDDPAQITATALADPNSPCGATLARFCAILGAVAGDVEHHHGQAPVGSQQGLPGVAGQHSVGDLDPILAPDEIDLARAEIIGCSDPGVVDQ